MAVLSAESKEIGSHCICQMVSSSSGDGSLYRAQSMASAHLTRTTSTDKIASGLVHAGAGRKGRGKEAQKKKSSGACLLKRHVLTTDGIQTQNWNEYIEGIRANRQRVIYVKRPPLKQ